MPVVDQAVEGGQVRRSVAVAALAIAAGLASPASAGGYEKTSWGMSLAQVQKLYPSGEVAKDRYGNTILSLSNPFGPIQEAYLAFVFTKGTDTLDGVEIHFPRRGTVPDQRKYTYLVMTDAQAAEAWATLRKYLVQKYGKPSDENVSPSYRGRARAMVGWKVAGNLIQLIREPQEDGALTDVFLLHSDLSNWGYPDK
jgi:hypothetical protein